MRELTATPTNRFHRSTSKFFTAIALLAKAIALLATAIALLATGMSSTEMIPAQDVTPATKVDQPVKVMSFNIRNGKAKDGENHWKNRDCLVAETIRMFDPDLLGTQEVFEFQADFLRQSLPEYGFHGVGRLDGATKGEYEPIMYKKDRFQLLESGHYTNDGGRYPSDHYPVQAILRLKNRSLRPSPVGTGRDGTGSKKKRATLTPENGPRQPLKVHGIFRTNMVLQRDKPFKIWGWATKGAKVRVNLGKLSGDATCEGETGRWQVIFEPQAANVHAQTITVASGDERIEMTNILIGDVWVMNGQSNMAVGLAGQYRGDVEMIMGHLPLLRHIRINPNESEHLLTDLADRAINGKSDRKDWNVATPETVGDIGAIGYFFASRIQRALQTPSG